LHLILHIGSTKTGTTSIQNFLFRKHSALRARGIFYPVKKSVTSNHILLPAGFVNLKKFMVPHQAIFLNSKALYSYCFKSFWNQLVYDLQKYNPHTVVLSAEDLFMDFTPISKLPFSALLNQLFDQITVVAYIRSPAPYYISRLSQNIRTGKKSIAPQACPIKSVIEYYEREFSGQVRVYPFEKQQLINGDALHDFLENNIPQALDLIGRKDQKSYNKSLPGELLYKLQKIRLDIQPDGHIPSVSTRAIMQLATNNYIKTQEGITTSNTLQLNSNIEKYIRRTATDYLWLKNKYGIVFNDLDYKEIGESENPYKDIHLVNEICIIDISKDKKLDSIAPPSNFFVRKALIYKFVLNNLVMAAYKSRIANTWVSKVKRFLAGKITRSPHAN
jgi:hypothetical protein